MAGSDYTILTRFSPDSFVADKFAWHTRFGKVGDDVTCNVTCLRSAIFSSVRKPHNESLACQKWWEAHDVYTLLTLRESHEQRDHTGSVY